MKKIYSILLIAMVLTACGAGVWPNKPVLMTKEHETWRDRYNARKLAKSDFNMSVISFTDNRRPRDMAVDHSENLIYEYKPNELLSGVAYRLPVLFDKHLGQDMIPSNIVYKVELELYKLRTAIRTGTLKMGREGSYDVDLEIKVIVRRPDSSILMQKVYDVQLDQKRKSFSGRGPSADMDKQKMFDLTEVAIRKIAGQVRWATRSLHQGTDVE